MSKNSFKDFQVKKIVANLLAQERLVVQHQPVPTASFDLKNRILTLPIFKDGLSEDHYNCFIAHEVGHALYTPANAINILAASLKNMYGSARGETFLAVAKSYLNIVEDIRIEQKIKNRYRGLTGSFERCYDDLHNNRNMFEMQGKNLADELFADRLNFKAKLGDLVDVPFSDEEQVYVNKAFACITYDDVIEVTLEIFQYAREVARRQQQEEQDSSQQNNSNATGTPNNFGSGSGSPVPSSSKASPSENSDDSSDSSEEEDDNNTTAGTNTGDEGTTATQANEDDEAKDENDDDVMPQAASDFNFEEFANLDAPATIVYDVRNDYDLSDIIEDNADFTKAYIEAIRTNERIMFENDSRDVLIAIEKQFKPMVSKMTQIFNRKKAADMSRREMVSSSGELDMNRLHEVGINEDIFLRMASVPEGKNHGLIMNLDWSGSMHGERITNAILQTMLLCMFCKSIGIPFDVYAFSDDGAYGKIAKNISKYGDKTAIPTRVRMMNLVSSRGSKKEYNTSMRILSHYAYCFKASTVREFAGVRNKFSNVGVPIGFGLSGTPLNQSLLCLPTIYRNFVKTHGTDICHTIIITDGEDGSSIINNQGNFIYNDTSVDSNIFGETKNPKNVRVGFRGHGCGEIHGEEDANNNYYGIYTNDLLRVYRDLTGGKLIGIFLGGSTLPRVDIGCERTREHEKEYYKTGVLRVDGGAYDTYYVINSSTLSPKKVKVTTADQKSVQKSFNESKASQKFVNAFVEQISTY